VTPLFIALAAVAALALIVALPRLLLARAQDRLARRLLDEDVSRFRLLTRAERVAGHYRRLPGVLGLTGDALQFEGLFGESETLHTSRIQKIVTGQRLASGRQLVRLGVLRITSAGGGETEFLLTRASLSAWRGHLGLWAGGQRQAERDEVTPGR
jgi:hypothetical protein